MEKGRWLRRNLGFLSARLPELKLGEVADPRHMSGRRWKIGELLSTMMVGLIAGAKSLKQVEALSSEMSLASRRVAGIVRRVADTTLRGLLVKLDPTQLRGIIHRAVKAANKRKALEPTLFGFGVVAMDGKATALPSWDDNYAQKVSHEERPAPYGLLRTMTATLISIDAKPCIDAFPIPADTNEMGAFAQAFDALCDTYPGLFDLCTYDAGATSEPNGAHVRSRGKHYFFRLKDERWHMRQYAEEELGKVQDVAETIDVIDNNTTTTRRVRISPVAEIPGRTLLAWSHTRTFVRVTSETKKHGVKTTEERFYACSMEPSAMTADKWLLLARLHWGVEHTHNRLDVVFEEDDHPFITYDPQGALAVMLLRRVAYTLVALFRGVTLRSESKRQMPWKDLMRRIYHALIAAGDEHARNLRNRAELQPVCL